MQLDTQARGFSFQAEAPLDMRFDPAGKTSAADLVNQLDEVELADILFRYGEEHRSRQVARAIVNARPITTTTQLAKVVAEVTGGGKSGIHPATRTFQALRIAVNGELEALEEVLPQTLEALSTWRSISDYLVPLAGRPHCQAISCAGEQRLHLPTSPASLYLWS